MKTPRILAAILATLLVTCSSSAKAADDEEKDVEKPGYWGGFNPGKGFRLVDTPYGTVNFSLYFLVRYLNQMPAQQTFTNHLGEQVAVDPRNDIQLQREMIFFSGWVYRPKLNYTAMVWTVNSTNQVAVAGNLSYNFSLKR